MIKAGAQAGTPRPSVKDCKVPPATIDIGVDEYDTLKERTPTPTMPKQLPLPLTFSESQQRFRSTYPKHGGKE